MNLIDEVLQAAPNMQPGESAVVVFNDGGKCYAALEPQRHDSAKINQRLGYAWRHGERRYLVARFKDKLYIYLDKHTLLSTGRDVA